MKCFLVLTWLSTGSSTPSGAAQNLEFVNFLLLTSLWLVFFTEVFTLSRPLVNSPKGHKLSSHIHPSCREHKHQLPSYRACAEDFGVYLSHFRLQQVSLSCYSATTVCFIHFSFNFLRVVQLRYTLNKTHHCK